MSIVITDCTTGQTTVRPLTADEQTQLAAEQQIAQQQAAAAAAVAQADSDDQTAEQQWLANIAADITNLTADSAALTGAGTLTTTQLRAMLARADDAIVRIDRGLEVLARRLARRGY